MDISTLENARNAFERSLDSLSVWLAFWTALVAIGLVVEYIPSIVEDAKKRDWKFWLKLSGAILITVGVAGEFAIEARSLTIETGLRGSNHRIEELLNSEAGTASKAAEKAT